MNSKTPNGEKLAKTSSTAGKLNKGNATNHHQRRCRLPSGAVASSVELILLNQRQHNLNQHHFITLIKVKHNIHDNSHCKTNSKSSQPVINDRSSTSPLIFHPPDNFTQRLASLWSTNATTISNWCLFNTFTRYKSIRFDSALRHAGHCLHRLASTFKVLDSSLTPNGKTSFGLHIVALLPVWMRWRLCTMYIQRWFIEKVSL